MHVSAVLFYIARIVVVLGLWISGGLRVWCFDFVVAFVLVVLALFCCVLVTWLISFVLGLCVDCVLVCCLFWFWDCVILDYC